MNPTNPKNTSSNPLQMRWSSDFDIENAYTQGYFSSKLSYVSSTKKRQFINTTVNILLLQACPSKNISKMFANRHPWDHNFIQVWKKRNWWPNTSSSWTMTTSRRCTASTTTTFKCSATSSSFAACDSTCRRRHSTTTTIQQQHKLKDNTL